MVGLNKDGKNKLFQHNTVIVNLRVGISNEMSTLWTFMELTLTNIRNILSVIVL